MMRQPLEMLDRQVLIGEWTARQVSTHWPISSGCEHPLQWSSHSSEVSQQGMPVQYHADNDGSGHSTDTEFSPELSANEVHGEVELCVLISSPRTLVERRRQDTKTRVSCSCDCSALLSTTDRRKIFFPRMPETPYRQQILSRRS